MAPKYKSRKKWIFGEQWQENLKEINKTIMRVTEIKRDTRDDIRTQQYSVVECHKNECQRKSQTRIPREDQNEENHAKE